MSRIYHRQGAAHLIREFTFEEVEAGAPAQKQKKAANQFVADTWGTGRARDFVPGGFDFDYEGGLRRDEILRRSTDEAERIVSQAKTEAGDIREKARAEGYEAGRKAGYQAGLDEAKPVIDSFQALAGELARVRAEYYQNAEREMIDLVVAVARTVIGLEAERAPELVRKVILKAVEQLRSREQLIIRVNTDDLVEAQKAVPQLTRMVEDIERVSFRGDPSVTRGGCMVETNIGMIDARIETQLEAIRENFYTAQDEERARKGDQADGR